MRALLVVNPRAGHRTAQDGDLEHCVARLGRAGFALDRVETAADHPSSRDLARRAVDEGYDACIVAGGDGTVAQAAAALVGTDVVLGILPFGSFMNIAHGLDLPLEPRPAAEVIARRRVHRADVGEVNGELFFETAGIGLDAELFGAARHMERRSIRRALRRVRRWLTHTTHPIVLDVDGERHQHRAMQVLVLNSPYYAWALRPLPDVVMDDGMLDIAVFPRMGRRSLFGSLVSVWRMNRLPGHPVRYRGATATMTADDPLSVHADGRVAGTLPTTFHCRRGALKVFA